MSAPCPLCGSESLNAFSQWTACDDGMKECPRIQCRDCFCEAPATHWNAQKAAILKAETRTAKMHDWAETLRESLRLKLEPGSDNLRPEYKLANDIVYGFRGRSVPALSPDLKVQQQPTASE